MLDRGNPTSERVAEYVRTRFPSELVFDVVVPRTGAAIDAFAAGQPLLLRPPDAPGGPGYTTPPPRPAGRLPRGRGGGGRGARPARAPGGGGPRRPPRALRR